MRQHGFLGSDTREQRLIEQTRNGNRDAFECLIEPYVKLLFNYISSRVNDVYDANDIIQNTMLSIWQSIGSYKYESSFKTWAFTIARRRLADFYRKSKKHESLPLTDFENTPVAKNNLDESLDRMDIDNALQHLSSSENELVQLIFQSGLSYSEISTVLEIPIGTIKSRMSSIKSKLRILLSQEG